MKLDLTTYKMRAEGMQHVADFANMVFTRTMMLERVHPFPDVDVTFTSELELEDLRDYIRLIPDGHIMLQTLQPADSYTGERDHNLF